eukprot:Gb_27149 [translate_table: standard]
MLRMSSARVPTESRLFQFDGVFSPLTRLGFRLGVGRVGNLAECKRGRLYLEERRLWKITWRGSFSVVLQPFVSSVRSGSFYCFGRPSFAPAAFILVAPIFGSFGLLHCVGRVHACRCIVFSEAAVQSALFSVSFCSPKLWSPAWLG